MREKDLKETGLADMAYKVDKDHEVQMARGDLYKIAKYGIKLHEMLKGVSEEQGLDGWVQAKITKAADYLGSVYHHLDYEMKFDEVTESKKADKFTPHMMYDPKTGKSKKANKEQDHIDMAKKGWTHDKPKKEDVKEAAPKKMKVTDADKKAGTEAYKRMKAGDDRYVDATTKGKAVEEARSSASDQAAKAGAYNGGKSIPKQNKKPGLQGKDLEDHRAKRSAEYEADLVKKRAENAARLKSYGEGYKKLPERGERAKKNKKVKEGGSYEDTLFAKLAEANSKKK